MHHHQWIYMTTVMTVIHSSTGLITCFKWFGFPSQILKHAINHWFCVIMKILILHSRQTDTTRSSGPDSRFVEIADPRSKILRYDEAVSARPPLRVDMEGPTPTSYTPRNKPLYETNAPSWSFGRKTFVEKGKAATSLYLGGRYFLITRLFFLVKFD